MSKFRGLLPFAALAILITFLYLYKLDGIGVLGPDEPRYASVGRTMAASGHFVTPVLWGKPWFEKPPLLYWMTALGTDLGLSPDLCGRLPVALLSLFFLGGMWVWVNREFGATAAFVAATTLATSAGWLTYSSFCLTDLPLAVTFSTAVFTACSLLRVDPLRAGTEPQSGVKAQFVLIGAAVGLAVLAKGLVPFALMLPFFWFLRSYVRDWWLALVACLAVALPWYWVVYARNGQAFIDDFFIKHHFERLYSATLLHVQPWYYYGPVLLLGLFPWTPLFGLLLQRQTPWDRRRQFLLSVAIVGFVFFSLSRNKLPHYILPMLPSLFVLLGAFFENRRLAQVPRLWFGAAGLLLATVPLVSGILGPVLNAGRISRVTFPPLTLIATAFILLPLLAVLLTRRAWLAQTIVLSSVASLLYLKVTSYPVIDEMVSPRSFWLANSTRLDHVCNGGTNRDWLYGLSYYRGADFAECQTGHFAYVIRNSGRGAPVLTPLPH